MKAALIAVIWLAAFIGFVYLQNTALQVFFDSCRKWREPPVWRGMCPPSTRHGVHT